MTVVSVPELCLVALVGISGSGKSTFARRMFAPFETVSSDFCRALVSGDENDQAASADAFDVLYSIVGTRLKRGLLTVVDATNLTKDARAQLLQVAKEHDVLPVAIVLDVEPKVALKRNASRSDRDFGDHVITRMHTQLRRSVGMLKKEGFRQVSVLRGSEIDDTVLVRRPLLTNVKHLTGPFDIIGDVHGCLDELVELLGVLGYEITYADAPARAGAPVDAVHPDGRTAVFVGDLVDRGPNSVGVLRLVMGMHAAGHALVVPGNHENRLIRVLDGRNIKITHGLETTMAELAAQPEDFVAQVREWCRELVSHVVLDDGKLIVAHAGLKEAYHGRASGRVRSFALYGDTNGEIDEYGLPVRYPWAEEYRGRATVVYGHTPSTRLEWVNNTLCVDTGCVFGGQLSALRYPERETVQVQARQVYQESAKPLVSIGNARPVDELRIDDVLGRRSIETGMLGRITIDADSAAGALEVMSRFALHPRLLPYLPPTMSPVATSKIDGFLEHPCEAFGQFADWGVPQVMCEEKHMGSRVVVYVARDEQAVYTRTGRAFFPDDRGAEFLRRVRAAATQAGIFAELGTDWLLLDCELLPWSLKAMQLVREQYAGVSQAGFQALPAEAEVWRAVANRGLDVGDSLRRAEERMINMRGYDAAWRRYCWEVDGLDGVQLAVFQILAAKGANFATRDHGWHMTVADRLVAADPVLFRPTRHMVVDTADETSRAQGVQWWLDLTSSGGEGMVVKPLANLSRTPKGTLVQPGVKVRGREYLRIIYGPDYTTPANLERLRDRNLGRKRSLALREYALGLEAIDRLVRGEPLWRIHEAVFAILALESEPVDPRL